MNINSLIQDIALTVATKPDNPKIITASKIVHYGEQIKSVVNHFEKLTQLQPESYSESGTQLLNDLYKSIFDYRYRKSQEETGENQSTEVGIRHLAGQGEINTTLPEFDKWIDDLISLGKKSDNEDIRLYSQTSESIGNSDFSIKIDGNQDSDLVMQILSLANDSELSLEPGYGFSFDVLVDGDNLLMGSLIVGEADSEGIVDYTKVDTELSFRGANKVEEITEYEQACTDSRICATTFLDSLQQKVDSGEIDIYDLDNVSIEIKRAE